MSELVLVNGMRFLVLLLVQALVFKRLNPGIESFNYLHVLLYPLFIMLLPLRTPSGLVLLLAFLLGLLVDIFYDSPGVHAGASVFTGFLRGIVLHQMEPRGGYNINFSPTKARMGARWFATYSALLLAGHLIFYFSLEAFTFAQFGALMLRVVVSYVISWAFIQAVMLVFNPQT